MIEKSLSLKYEPSSTPYPPPTDTMSTANRRPIHPTAALSLAIRTQRTEGRDGRRAQQAREGIAVDATAPGEKKKEKTQDSSNRAWICLTAVSRVKLTPRVTLHPKPPRLDAQGLHQRASLFNLRFRLWPLPEYGDWDIPGCLWVIDERLHGLAYGSRLLWGLGYHR